MGSQGCNRWITRHMADISLIYLVATIPPNSQLILLPTKSPSSQIISPRRLTIRRIKIALRGPTVFLIGTRPGRRNAKRQRIQSLTATPHPPSLLSPRDFPCMPATMYPPHVPSRSLPLLVCSTATVLITSTLPNRPGKRKPHPASLKHDVLQRRCNDLRTLVRYIICCWVLLLPTTAATATITQAIVILLRWRGWAVTSRSCRPTFLLSFSLELLPCTICDVRKSREFQPWNSWLHLSAPSIPVGPYSPTAIGPAHACPATHLCTLLLVLLCLLLLHAIALCTPVLAGRVRLA